ncbi:E3 ubiquitin-protein ligase ARIH2 [Fulvia fulva]|uniref:RBR-type E3 ubiquitin transferase n=1 Tax=Passalora fulva TaxID=5499 RepID=A0A9Q8PCG4_PASFU|nr:E3 ubiquitin-protein ligase ARIH2 [Fulvia fulva]KAK4619419.1 E3 ubiquitin-protein ligase ARIH2 [Fulvia fulva]KAK4621129.1 E3 ubiquitin-protein ligase ARIH2 [Fulvia fulva]UJO19956.1 E3 ubiquitin-protein ligase ARIH2 [Fulvia fulva]WPV17112.1 E3 ubiquitin-protein ligase ARIH2 [Fulvia fulva]WPV32410.1 E3 ubiquitin-protein ligase ARIH2 [Fulvia fulva]
MAIAILGGRSRHGGRSIKSHRSKASTKHTTTTAKADEEVAPKPDVEELRRRRLAYLSVSPAARRRLSASSTKKPNSVESSRSTAEKVSSEHRQRKSKHKSSSSNPEKSTRPGLDRTAHYVYGTSASSSSKQAGEGDDRAQSSHGSPPRRRSLPTVVESEVTPDDSISQVGMRPSKRPTSRSSRASVTRNSTSAAKLASIAEDERAKTSPSKRSSKRDSTSSLLGSLLRRHTEPAVPVAPRLVECLTCAADDVPITKSAKLGCGHRMCHDCLKRVFEMSVKDPQNMPPRCCTNDHIPLKYVDRLFDLNFKMLWNRKYQEYHTKNRIYCPMPKCGEWIKPSHVHSYQGRKFAQCSRCNTKVCTQCNAKMHKSKDCPNDPEMAKLVAQAKEQGWKTCYNCHAMVELKEGCNHMTCRCMAEFCMVCGSKWKTCDCPWFNYGQTPDADRLNEWRIPEPIQIIYRRAFGAPEPVQGGDVPPPPVDAAVPRERRQPTYQDELDQRRRQERDDERLARRLQLATLIDPDDEPRHQQQRQTDVEAWGLGNNAGHFLNDNFVQNAANVVMSAFGDAAMGRRGERASGRRRRARETQEADTGLAPNFLGDESVLGVGPAEPSGRRGR